MKERVETVKARVKKIKPLALFIGLIIGTMFGGSLLLLWYSTFSDVKILPLTMLVAFMAGSIAYDITKGDA